MAKTYNKDTNPDGIASLGIAENFLCHEEICEQINKNFKVTSEHLTYGQGCAGMTRARKAMAKFFNQYFDPVKTVIPQEIILTSGVTAAVNMIGFATADDGDGVLISRPLYTSFVSDLKLRNKIKLCPVSLAGLDPFSEACIERYEQELQRQKDLGVSVKAMIFCK
jgi:1-aminocyclopropane-1-carboxylate synthase